MAAIVEGPPPGSPTCPNNHPWDASMRRCRTCRAPNPAYVESGKQQDAVRAFVKVDPPEGGATSSKQGEKVLHEDLAKVSVEANLEAFQHALKNFRTEYPEGRIIGVFGSPDSGKSFLNARLEWLMQAKRSGTVGGYGYRVIRATQANTATWAIFDLRGPFGAKRKVLVVDLPGEEFRRSTLEKPQGVQQHMELLEVADSLLVYISADVIDNQDAFQGSVRVSGRQHQQHYLRFLELAHECRARRPDHLCDLPVFIALSRADRVLRIGERAVPDAWQYISRKSEQLAICLINHFSSFCCGFVASHAGAETCIALRFSPQNPGDKWASLGPRVEQALEGAPLEAYFRACLKSAMTFEGGDIDRLPTLDELRACSISEEEFARSASLVAKGDAEEYRATLERVRDLVSITSTPMTNDRLSSFGVRSMLDRIFDLMEEPTDGIHRGVEFYYAKLRRWDSARSRWKTLAQDAAAWVAQRLPASGSMLDLLVRRLRLSSRRHELRARISGVVVGVLLALWGVYQWHAVPTVEERRENARQTVRGVAPLPPGFALDPDEVWDLDESRVERIRRDIGSGLQRLGLHDDHLLRAPNFEVAREINERGEEFYALRPDGRDSVARFFAGIDCSEIKSCRLPLQADQSAVVDPGRGRVLNYAAALNTYLSGGSGAEVDKYLVRFERARNGVWGRNLSQTRSPTKQILLPRLLVQLLQAHSALRDARHHAGDDGRAGYAEYGGALVAALTAYQADSATLLTANTARMPADLSRELQAIGVEPEVLAAHLLATAVVSTDSIAELREEVSQRLEPLAQSNPSRTAFEEQYAKQYPELLCFYYHLLRVGSAEPGPAYAKACQFTPSTPGLPFSVERMLVDPKFWAAGRGQSDIAFERWVPLIRLAAMEAAKSEPEPPVLSSLDTLSKLQTERPAWRLMLEASSLLWLLIWGIIAAATGLVLVSFWRVVLAAHRLVAPYTKDVPQP